MGFLQLLQSVLHSRLQNQETDRRRVKKGQSAVVLEVGVSETELNSGWSRRHGWNKFNFSVIKLEVDLL